MKKTKTSKKPYKKGFLPVGEGHEIYFELYGNPKGTPVVFLHGGPGAGFSKKDYDFFDQKKFNVLFFDQRGSGKSKAKTPLEANTTTHLVEDTKKLIEHAGFEKAIIFGGSWGSTLALIFAITHPEMVQGIVLRGVFLADRTGRQHLYLGGIKNFFPKEWSNFISIVPKKQRNNPEKYYYKKMLSKNRKTSQKYAKAWTKIELSLLRLKHDKKELNRLLGKKFDKKFALIECHYLSSNCFVAYDYIKKNLHNLKHLPASIVHGRYDMVCPPASALELHAALPNSRLFYTTAGHASREKETKEKLVEEINRMAKLVKYKKNQI